MRHLYGRPEGHQRWDHQHQKEHGEETLGTLIQKDPGGHDGQDGRHPEDRGDERKDECPSSRQQGSGQPSAGGL